MEQVFNELKNIGSKIDTKYDELKNDLVTRIEKANEQSQNSINGIDAALKSEIKNISEELVEIKKSQGNLHTSTSTSDTPYNQVFKAIEENKERIKEKERFKFNLSDIHTKVAADMASSSNFSGTNFVEPNVVTPWNLFKYEPQHIRDIVSSSPLSSDKVAYTVQTASQSGVAEVAEGGTKPQSDASFEKKIVIVSKLAHYYRIPEEMLEDNTQLSAAITTIGLEELKKKEDYDLLYKNGAGLEYDGLTVVASSFSDPTSKDLKNNYDVMVAAVTQLRKERFRPNFILVNPATVADMILEKDTSDRYLFPELIRTGSPNVLNVPIIGHSDVTAGTFLMGDSTQARIWDRKGAEVRFFEQDRDNAIKNMVTIVLEQRHTMAVYYPKAFVTGTFSTIITNA